MWCSRALALPQSPSNSTGRGPSHPASYPARLGRALPSPGARPIGVPLRTINIGDQCPGPSLETGGDTWLGTRVLDRDRKVRRAIAPTSSAYCSHDGWWRTARDLHSTRKSVPTTPRIGAYRASHLYRNCRRAGHARRSGRNGAKICANPRGRIGTLKDLLERSDLRRPSTGQPAAIAPRTELRAMAACSSQRQAVK